MPVRFIKAPVKEHSNSRGRSFQEFQLFYAIRLSVSGFVSPFSSIFVSFIGGLGIIIGLSLLPYVI